VLIFGAVAGRHSLAAAFALIVAINAVLIYV
jgi:hypothetical protein